MSSNDGHNDDLDWLYGGDREPASTTNPSSAASTRFPGRESVTWSEAADAHPVASTPAPYPEPVRPARPVAASTPSAKASSRSTEPKSVSWSEEDVEIQPAPRPTKASTRTAEAEVSGVTRKHRRIRIRTVLNVIGALLLGWVLFVGIASFHAWSTIDTVDSTPMANSPATQPGTTFLLVGTDERVNQDPAEPVRADSMMIYYVPKSGRSALISLPRDSYVPIPGVGSAKLNAAYSHGGPQLLTETVELITGLRIDGYIEVGFEGFIGVIDSIGGIELCLAEAMFDVESELDLPAGCQRLDGTQALAYSRMRYADARGDLGRVERQQQVMKAMAVQAATPATVLNPVRYWKFTHSVARTLTRGEKTSLLMMLPAVRGAIGFARDEALSFTVPISDPNAMTDAGSSVLWDREQASQLFDEIARGDTSQLDRFTS